MDKYRLHELEALLDLYSTEPYMFRPAELYKLDGPLRTELENYNLYMVGTRPRISLKPDSLSLCLKSQTIEGDFIVNLSTETKLIPFKFENRFDYPITHLCPLEKPYNNIKFVLGNQIPVRIRMQDLMQVSISNLKPYSDLKIEYIGQSFGNDGSSDAIDRLIGKTGKQGHASLQQVLVDINESAPENEVQILLYSFGFYKKFIYGGAGPEPTKSYDEAPNRFEQFMNASVPRGNRIDLIEASLIRYFQPKYNDIYKKTFPKATHVILEELFKLDITGLSTSVVTSDLNIRLYSEKTKPSDVHLSIYPILKDSERMGFLDLMIPTSEL